MKTRVVVKALIRTHEDRYLVLRRTEKERIDPGQLDLPGGKVRFGEEPLEALKREVREEVGLTVEPIEPILTWSRLFGDVHYIGILFSAVAETTVVVLSEEHEHYDWVELNELLGLPLFEPIRGQLEMRF